MANRRDFLDEIIDERSARNAEFPDLVEAALRRRQLLRELAARREKLGLSQTLVAARMGTSQSAVAQWRGTFPHGLTARTRIGALNRRARDPYALWDFYCGWSRHSLRPFLQLTNITSTQYEEIPGVVMPRRAIVGGIEWLVGRK